MAKIRILEIELEVIENAIGSVTNGDNPSLVTFHHWEEKKKEVWKKIVEILNKNDYSYINHFLSNNFKQYDEQDNEYVLYGKQTVILNLIVEVI